MAKRGSVGEIEIQHAILELMRDGKIWSNADLKQRLERALPWDANDLTASPKRPNERRWENRVNNALSQSPKRSASLYAKGHVENVGHGLHRITAGGSRFIDDEFEIGDFA